MKERLTLHSGFQLNAKYRPFTKESSPILNIYGKDEFKPERSRLFLESLAGEFKTFFLRAGYSEVAAVPISSGIDPTVRFIGSHISVFKPNLEHQTIPNPGLFMVQNCIRTRNVQEIFNDTFFPKWGSFFPSFGVIAPPERLDDLYQDTLSLLAQFGISRQHIRIRINSEHSELMAASQKLGLGGLLQVDTQKPGYYQHKLGMDKVRGRNLNIAIQNPKTGEFSDIGNIIVIEDDQKQLGIELAIGETTTLKELYGLDHVLDCHPVAELNGLPDVFRRKLQDAILISTTLYREGLRPNGSDNRSRLMRTYVRSISYLRSKTNISLEKMIEIIASFEEREFADPSALVAPEIGAYLKAFENQVNDAEELTEEETIIAAALLHSL